MTTTSLDWCSSEELITERWLLSCEKRDRYSKIFKPLQLSDRLKRLLPVAYCYDIWPLIKDKRSRDAVEVAEKYADKQATKKQLTDAAYAAYAAYATYAAADAAYAAARKEKWITQGKLLVSVIGPRWIFDNQWRTSTAIAIAAQMYESCDFSAMPILADAIQDAGCEEEILLRQMRNLESKWCRGSRIVDELLGKR